jgi:hypothetical protein
MAETDEVCRSFRNTGNCRFGDDCKFVHSDGEPIQAPQRPRKECFNFRDNGNCDHGDRCRFTHGEADSRFSGDIADEVCRNFQRGRCKFGDDCRRKHEGPVVTEDEGDKGGDRARKPRKPRRRAENNGNPDEVCKNFLAGRCRFGDECRRKHEGTPTPAAAGEEKPRRARAAKPVKKLDEACNNFAAGKCRLGDKCRRQHVEA